MLRRYNQYSVKQKGNVAQASSWWQKLVNQIQRSQLAIFERSTFASFKIRRFRGAGGWLFVLTVMVAMLFWNWQLLLATSVGVFIMLFVYLMQGWDWRIHWLHLRQLLSGSNQELTLAVGSGGVATLSTYMAVSIWIDSDSHWIAAGAILQGLGTLITIVLLVWQIISRQLGQDEAKLNAVLADLTDVDPLKRLIAVRQLTQQVINAQVERRKRREIADYLHLMLSREQESVVRDAVLDGLQALEDKQLLGKAAQPLQTPLSLKRNPVKIHRS